MLDTWLSERLEKRRRSDLYRVLPTHQPDITDFTSNDYLGLAANGVLAAKIRSEVIAGSNKNGSTGSRLLSGNFPLAIETEKRLADIFKSGSALIFNSGYSANLAVLSSIPQRNDTILFDELSHASIKDGIRLSLAGKFSFKHNDLNDLEKKIRKSSGRVFVVAESVYSMDGDECPMEDLVNLSEKYDFHIILDEAHTTGARGPAGGGIAVEKGLERKIDVRILTFGKAMGICGACIAGSETLIDFLVNFSRPFLYTTAPSPHMFISIGCAFEFLSANIDLQNVLKSKVGLYLKKIADNVPRTSSQSAIQTIIVPGNTAARQAARALQREGFDVRPILSPTVPEGSERLRICLHTYNTEEEILALTQVLNNLVT